MSRCAASVWATGLSRQGSQSRLRQAIMRRKSNLQDEACGPNDPSRDPMPMTHTVAIMQPYFIPYAGYFRLFAASDLFVVYDCVQFPRRGWVHRNRLADRNGALRWLTLPLRSAPQDVLIRDLQFTSDAQMLVTQRLRPFDVAADDQEAPRGLVEAIRRVQGSPLDSIVLPLDYVVDSLGLPRTLLAP